jgi:hypothetical protein
VVRLRRHDLVMAFLHENGLSGLPPNQKGLHRKPESYWGENDEIVLSCAGKLSANFGPRARLCEISMMAADDDS